MSAIDWTPLRTALRRCRAAGIPPALWWRDDDAVAPTAQLDQLIALARDLGLHVHLAVIPADATEALVATCASAPLLPVVHGWHHTDHSGGLGKKNEFQTPRAEAIADMEYGAVRMRALFGPTLRMMFVPPWNRINREITKALPQRGFLALSTFGPRGTAMAAPGLAQINTHVDPIHWKAGGGLIDPAHLVALAAAELEARANGTADADEPFGLLSHHLVHDPAIWDFCRSFLSEMLSGGATQWQMERTP